MINGFKNRIIYIIIFSILWSCNFTSSKLKETEYKMGQLFSVLCDSCSTPDNFAMSSDGKLFLSCPNYAEKEVPGMLLELDKKGLVINQWLMPGIDEEGFGVPKGMDFGSDGALYVAINQRGKGGAILRLILGEEQIINKEVIVSGLQNPNGLKCNNGAIYVTCPQLPKIKGVLNISGVFRYSEHDRDIIASSDENDPNLIFIAYTKNPNRQFGLDGLEFGDNGDLFVGDFGDCLIYNLNLNSNGKVEEHSIFVSFPDSTGIDGMVFDSSGNLYVAGFAQNQVWKVNTNGKIEKLVDYPDNNGENGAIDQPADLFILGDKLLISNFDLMVTDGMVNQGHSKPYTISSLKIK